MVDVTFKLKISAKMSKWAKISRNELLVKGKTKSFHYIKLSINKWSTSHHKSFLFHLMRVWFFVLDNAINFHYHHSYGLTMFRKKFVGQHFFKKTGFSC